MVARQCLNDIFELIRYGRREILSTPAIVKGVLQEEEAIHWLGELDNDMYTKNRKRVSNDYLTGEVDVELFRDRQGY